MNSSFPLPSPPPGYVSTAAIQPLVYVLILSAVWSSVLVAIFFFMFFLSTSHIRRSLLFLMNVVAVVSGVVAGFIQVDRMTLGILYPDIPIDNVIQRTPPVLFMILPIYIDCILAVRLYIVYPRSMTSSSLLALIFTPVAVLKVLRIINAVYFFVRYFQHLERDSSIWDAFVAIWFETPCMQIEWIAGLFDNCWASVWFLWRLHRDVMVRGSSSDIVATNGTLRNVSRQLRKLFYIGLSTFVFPSILNIISVIICYKGSIFSDIYTFVFVSNTYFQIIGVQLATIWVSKERSAHRWDLTCPASLHFSLPFHATTVDPRVTWASENPPLGPTSDVEGQGNTQDAVIMQMDSFPPTPIGHIPPKENIV
ncbi:hypothetical protein DL96DRAFT_1281143 [Flagelloscypha sp. PMI_526]|nr:hypothetical protein DL96DRAFT_1281143 [Flagelloscypha sp. PMI_526]